MAKATLNKQISINVELSEEEATKVLYALSLLKNNFSHLDPANDKTKKVLEGVFLAIEGALRDA